MGSLQVRRVGYALGARVTGLNASEPLDDETVACIRRALLEHMVLCFPAQELDLAQFRQFCSHFGELDAHRGSMNNHPDAPGVILVASKPVQFDRKRGGAYGKADYWHTDGSHTVRPQTLSFLYAQKLPDVGGDTMFANQYMAYDALSPAFRATIENLRCVQDYTLGQPYEDSTPEERAKSRLLNPPVVQPVVTVHPETGKKALYLGENKCRNFVGMTEEETKPLLDFLHRHASRYEFVYRHAWNVHDIVLWDNRCTLHYAVTDYDRSQLRMLVRCSLVGPQTGSVYEPDAEPAATPA